MPKISRRTTPEEAIDYAVERTFVKKVRFLKVFSRKERIAEANRPMVVEPLVKALEQSPNLQLGDVLEGVKYLHPDYKFTSAAPAILNIAIMFAKGRRGEFPLGAGNTTEVIYQMSELNRAKYDSSRQYYQAVEDLSNRRM